MIASPPMMRTHGFVKSAAPTRPAVVPSVTKINESPALKASELMMTARRAVVRDPSPPFNWSMLTPEIKEM